MVAQHVKDISDTQRLFKVDPEIGYSDDEKYSYVVSSRCNEMTASIQGCYEVYLFGADSDGKIVNWSELPGSQKHCSELDKPILDLGYSILPS